MRNSTSFNILLVRDVQKKCGFVYIYIHISSGKKILGAVIMHLRPPADNKKQYE